MTAFALELAVAASAGGARTVTLAPGGSVRFAGSSVQCEAFKDGGVRHLMCQPTAGKKLVAPGAFVAVLPGFGSGLQIEPGTNGIEGRAEGDYASDAIDHGLPDAVSVGLAGHFALGGVRIDCFFTVARPAGSPERLVVCENHAGRVGFAISDRAVYALRYDASGNGKIQARIQHKR
jgi:hypothetical protein